LIFPAARKSRWAFSSSQLYSTVLHQSSANQCNCWWNWLVDLKSTTNYIRNSKTKKNSLQRTYVHTTVASTYCTSASVGCNLCAKLVVISYNFEWFGDLDLTSWKKEESTALLTFSLLYFILRNHT
jgi:hypothetical protein